MASLRLPMRFPTAAEQAYGDHNTAPMRHFMRLPVLFAEPLVEGKTARPGAPLPPPNPRPS